MCCVINRYSPSALPSVICHVHVSVDSYLSVHTHRMLEAHELLRIVGSKLDRSEEEMVLAVVSHTGGD